MASFRVCGIRWLRTTVRLVTPATMPSSFPSLSKMRVFWPRRISLSPPVRRFSPTECTARAETEHEAAREGREGPGDDQHEVEALAVRATAPLQPAPPEVAHRAAVPGSGRMSQATRPEA